MGARRAAFVATLCAALLAGSLPAQAGKRRGAPWGDGRSRATDLGVSLVTFGPGDAVMSYFGHNALLVRDRRLKVARLYNFGMFHFAPDTTLDYLQGRLTFWGAEKSVSATYQRYERAGRSITAQALYLSPAQALRLAQALAKAVLPAHREYRYHHYEDNCSTRVRDLLDAALDGQLKADADMPGRLDLRGHTRRHSGKQPIVDFALTFWMNDSMERPITVWQEMFLPGEIRRVISGLRVQGPGDRAHPLVRKVERPFVADRPPVPEHPPVHWPHALALGLILGAAAWRWGTRPADHRAARWALAGLHAVVGLVLGGVATAGTLMWAFTEWDVTFRNVNQLLANPLTLALAPLGVLAALDRPWARRAVARIGAALAMSSAVALLLNWTGASGQANGPILALLVPLNVGLAAGARRWLAPTAASGDPVAPPPPQESA